MLCSAPQPSKATWFSTRPHWPAAPGAGKASPAAPHHLRNSRDQTSHPFTREGITIPLLQAIIPSPHPPPSAPGAASVCPKQLQLPLCQRCQEWGQPWAQLPARGTLLLALPLPQKPVPKHPLSLLGQPVPTPHRSGATGDAFCWWDEAPPGQGDFCPCLAHFPLCLSFFPLAISFNA